MAPYGDKLALFDPLYSDEFGMLFLKAIFMPLT
jgi:hypothetical protein